MIGQTPIPRSGPKLHHLVRPYHTRAIPFHATATATATAGATSCPIGIDIEVEFAFSLAVPSQSESFFPQKPARVVLGVYAQAHPASDSPYQLQYILQAWPERTCTVQLYNCTSDVQIRIDALKEAHRWGPTRKEMSFTGSAIAGGPRCRHSTRAHKPT